MSDNVPLLRLYEFLRSMSGEERLEFARWITAKPELFNEWSRRSLRFFASGFSNVDEDFHPPRPELPAADTVKEIRRGYDVAVLLADRRRGRWWEVEDAPELGFRFVDYELAPLRKTSAARAEGEPAEKAGMRADLLLVSADGVPIVGEVKAATETGHDTDPVLALIQGLTACAQLLSAQQMERLERAYPLAQFRAFSVLDLFVIVVKPSQSAPSTFQDDLYDTAKKLAPILAAEPSVPARRIAFIEARFDGRLELKLASKDTASTRKKITSRSRRAPQLSAEPPDPDKEPRANRDPRELERKVALLHEPHVAPLTAFVERLRALRGGEAVPWFDPTEAGVEARILFLLEAPGGRAALADGSGFISPDNDDRTAKTMWTLLREVGLDTRREVVTWNVVPWYVGDDNRIRGVTVGDLDEARPALRELLSLLPNLRVVLLLGAKAARGWERAQIEGDYAILRAPHPSPRGTASRPGARDEIRDALITARRLAGYAKP
jgi:uracil-DNA glycosylase